MTEEEKKVKTAKDAEEIAFSMAGMKEVYVSKFFPLV